MCSTAPWNVKRFGVEGMNESVIPLLRTLWNCYSFTVRYMQLDRFDPKDHRMEEEHLSPEDEWILSAADHMTESVAEAMEKHEYHHAVAAISEFTVEDLSRWYIKLIRDRLWLEDKGGKIDPSKKAAYMTLSTVFERLCCALAPIAPFISEEIFQNMLGKDVKSVHLMAWPKPAYVDEKLMYGMGVARAVFEAGSRCRQEAKIKLRHPIRKVTVSGDAKVKEAISLLEPVMMKQLNCKGIEFVTKLPGITYTASPDFKIIGPKFGKEAGKVAQAIKENPAEAKKIKEKGKATKIGGYEITPEMILDIKLQVSKEYAAADFTYQNSSGLVMIETKRDESLMNEGLARDIIRNVQELRKKNDLAELQRIKVELSACKAVEAMLTEFKQTILNEVRGDSIKLTKGLKTEDSFEYEGEDISYKISF